MSDEGRSESKEEAMRLAARFAWPTAAVLVAAMGFAYLHGRPEPTEGDVRVHASTTVIQSLRDVARLETTAMHVEKVIDVKDHQKRLYGLVEGDDALLFVASGEVILGVDLSRLRDEDVQLDDATKTATIVLPEPEVFSARFDEIHSHVHARNTDVLAKRNEQLESIARKEAVAAFEAAGRTKEASDRAKAQGERQLRALATALGATKVVISWRPIVPPEVGIEVSK